MVPSIKSRARPEAFSFFFHLILLTLKMLFFLPFSSLYFTFSTFFFIFYLSLASPPSKLIDFVLLLLFFFVAVRRRCVGRRCFRDRSSFTELFFFGVASIFIELGWPCSAVLFFFWLPGFVIFIGFFSSVDSVLPGRTGFYRVFLSFFYRVLKRLPSFSWL